MCGHWRCSTVVSPGDNVGFTSRAQTEGCGERTELSHWNMLALYLQPLEQIKRQINCTPEWGQGKGGGATAHICYTEMNRKYAAEEQKDSSLLYRQSGSVSRGKQEFFFSLQIFLKTQSSYRVPQLLGRGSIVVRKSFGARLKRNKMYKLVTKSQSSRKRNTF